MTDTVNNTTETLTPQEKARQTRQRNKEARAEKAKLEQLEREAIRHALLTAIQAADTRTADRLEACRLLMEFDKRGNK